MENNLARVFLEFAGVEIYSCGFDFFFVSILYIDCALLMMRY